MGHRDEVVRSRIVAQLLIVDGQLTDDERSFLFKLMGRLELSAEEQAEVIDSVNVDDSIEEILAAVSVESRAAMIEDLKAAAEADGHTGPGEAAIIERVVALAQRG